MWGIYTVLRPVESRRCRTVCRKAVDEHVDAGRRKRPKINGNTIKYTDFDSDDIDTGDRGAIMITDEGEEVGDASKI